MLTLAGFTFNEQPYLGENSLVYRGIRDMDARPVIAKVLKDHHPTQEQKAGFTREYEILSKLPTTCTVESYGLEPYQGSLVFIMEAFGTHTLQQLLEQSPPSLEDVLNILIKIADALETIHSLQIIHKDLNPHNILWDAKTGQIRIIDFGISCTLQREELEIQNIQAVEGMLPYMSPEQTGRMNRGMDYRSDYYSLGVIFYQMLTQQLPFQASDTLGWIHCHIAMTPQSPSEIKPEIPDVISAIVLKLMAKNAEERYQSLYGLKIDLRHCLEYFKKNRVMPTFVVGSKDISPRFFVPEKLYGREAEIHELLTTFDRASEGRAEIMLVAGYSGIGKSHLIREIRKPITAKRGYFISGKFDQFSRDIPYAALVQAFTLLIQMILTESEEQVQAWKSAILEALSHNGQVMLDFIPSLINIIGEQPTIAQLEGKEAQNRFHYVFQQFISILAKKEHPLVIFLDDLQWVDTPSLELLQLLLTTDENKYFLIIGAYRNNEVDDIHPLSTTLKLLRKNDALVNTLNVLPLSIQHVTQLLADTLRQSVAAVSDLAKICMEKTHGNPFFLDQFLLRLYEEELIKFNYQQGHWYWQTQKIRQKNYTDNVVVLMSLRIHELPSETQAVLRLAACLGNRFELTTLAIVAGQTPKETAAHLYPALQQEFIVPMDERYKYVPYIEDENESVAYQFLHDQIEQAAYRLFPEQELSQVHLKIGWLLLEHTKPEHLSEMILEIVNHLNKGVTLITEAAEKEQLAELNLMAAQKSKNNISYDLALSYLKTGMSLLEEDAWQNQYTLTLALYVEGMEVAYLAAKYTEMDFFAEQILKQVKDPLDAVKIYRIKIQFLVTKVNPVSALSVGNQALALLGIHLPENPSNFQAIKSFTLTQLRLAMRSMKSLYHLPPMTDPYAKAAMVILEAMIPLAYISQQINFYALIILKCIQLTLKYGVTLESTSAFLIYGAILIGKFGNVDLGCQYAALAEHFFKNLPALKQNPRFIVSSRIFIDHHKNHLKDIIEVTLQDFQQCIEVGELEGASYELFANSISIFLSGKPLEFISEQIKKFMQSLEKVGSKIIWRNLALYWQLVLQLQGVPKEEIRREVTLTTDDQWIGRLITEKDYVTLLTTYMARMIVAYFLENYQEAYVNMEKAMKYVGAMMTMLFVPAIYFYSGLICSSTLLTKVGEQRRTIKKLRISRRKLRWWARHAPMNYLHKYYLLTAEEACVTGRKKRAQKYYDLAIFHAHKNEYYQEEALVNELAARFYLANQQEKIAQLYLQEAYTGYVRWGAFAKVHQLEEKYADIFSQAVVVSTAEIEKSLTTRTYVGSTVRGKSTALDLATLMKAAQVISKEVLLADLLRNMLAHVMENAGAQKGCLLLETNDQWYVEAKAIVGGEPVVLKSLPLEENVPVSVIKYVIRTRELFISNNAMLEEQLAEDPYIQAVQPKSLLCLPLLSHGHLKSILYLENNAITHVFNQQRLDLLKLLSGQIVISIENTKFYERLIELNLANARFVPTEFLNLLGKKEIFEVKLGDHIQKNMAVLFLDVLNFTAFSEKRSPQENFEFINQFLSKMVPVITAHEGFVDKYLGDGIMALFPSGVDAAVQAGIDMLQTLDRYNEAEAQKGQQALHIGMGLNSGLLMLGVVGEAHHMEGTVISDAVNLASRVQDLTKNYGVSLLITDAVYMALKEKQQYAMRKIGMVQVRGKTTETLLWEVFEADAPHLRALKLQTRALFERGVELYHDQAFKEAELIFQEVLQSNPEDEPARIYQQWCRV